MAKTALQTMRADLEAALKDDYSTITIKAVVNLIDQILPYEKEEYRKCFEAGFIRRSSLTNYGPTTPDFPTWFRQFETEQSSNQSPEPQEELWNGVENEIANVVYRKPAGSTHITPIIEVLKSKFNLTRKQNTP